MVRPLARRLLIATAMAALVAVGARGGSAVAGLRLGRPEPMALFIVLAAAIVLGVAGAWAVERLVRRRRSGGDRDSVRSWGVNPRRLFPAAAVAVALLGLLGISRLNLATEPAPVGVEQSRGGGRPGRPLGFNDYRSSPVLAGEGTERPTAPVAADRPLQVGAALVVLLLGGTALAWWRVKRRRRAGAEDLAGEVDTEAARGTVLRSIEAMLADPDPKTAIIGAYARLLEGLAASGVPHRYYEGPVEHLRRALTRLHVRPAPIRRLVSLFEVARFSTQALTVRHRDEALEALRDVASDLGRRNAAAPEAAVALASRTDS